MGKRENDFNKIEAYKQKFKALSTEAIKYRLNHFDDAFYRDARIALRQILEEREQQAPDVQDEG